jgi:hypothetical protein
MIDINKKIKQIRSSVKGNEVRESIASGLEIMQNEANNRLSDDSLNSIIRGAVGSPLVAKTGAEMTDTNKVYVYTGSEDGYIYGNWYYYDGSAWADGGAYNSTAMAEISNTEIDEIVGE